MSKKTDAPAPHPLPGDHPQHGCPFCDEGLSARAEPACGTCYAVADRHPVAPGHMLIIPRRHVLDWFGLTEQERRDADTLLHRLRARIMATDPTVTGFNIGMNCGAGAGQTIFHAHIHLIPRRKGDCADPRGGVRGVIPGRMGYPAN